MSKLNTKTQKKRKEVNSCAGGDGGSGFGTLCICSLCGVLHLVGYSCPRLQKIMTRNYKRKKQKPTTKTQSEKEFNQNMDSNQLDTKPRFVETQKEIAKAVAELREIAKSYKSLEDKGWLAKGQISDVVNWEEIEQLFTQKLEQLAKQKDEEFLKINKTLIAIPKGYEAIEVQHLGQITVKSIKKLTNGASIKEIYIDELRNKLKGGVGK